METITLYNKTVSGDVLSGLIARIKEKKELVNLDEEVCVERIARYLMQHGKLLAKLSEARSFSAIARSKEAEEIVKAVREEVRLAYGLYQTEDIGKLGHHLDKLERELEVKPIERTKETHDSILRLNRSTAERLGFYERFFSDIFAITGRPEEIVDLACGLNPMAWHYHRLRDVQYTAFELNETDARHLQRYFDLRGSAYRLDLEKDPSVFKADVCFLLKVLDLLDPKDAERIITTLRCRWIVASFPTKTITDQEMRFKRRAGFQKMLRRLGLKYTTLTYENELVYIIEKGAA
jgi:16S rRNA (guanine(1405)-N(7))-methyltransferase